MLKSLNKANYYNNEMNQEYMSVSQWKSFKKCESYALAEIRGEIKTDKKCFQLGHYMHAWNEGILNEHIEENKGLIYKKNGSKYEDYMRADLAINLMEKDLLVMKALEGQKEVIMTGEIKGVPWKIRIDNLHSKRFSDLKYIKSFESIYDREQHKRVSFIEHWGYHIQMAVYQEIIRQNIGKRLEPLIVAVTKEIVPNKAIFGQFENDEMENLLNIVETYQDRFVGIKNGEIEPNSCEECEWCRRNKEINEITKWNKVF